MKLDGLRPGQSGWKSIIRVRLLHAKIRKRILTLPVDKYDKTKDGVPINQEDLNITLSVFSFVPLFGVENVFGTKYTTQEKDGK